MTIPVSQLIKIVPNVLSVGATAVPVALTGLILTQNTECPFGQVVPFSSPQAVGAYFGLNSTEYQWAQTYFTGYDSALQQPYVLKFAQFNTIPVAAYLRGGSVAALTLSQLQALTGTIIVTIDGVAHTSSSVNLSGATSFSNAASLIQTALAANDATMTGSIAPLSAAGVGGSAITGGVVDPTQLAVATAPANVYLAPGTAISGAGISAATITRQLSGTPGGVGVYDISVSQTIAIGTAVTFANGTLTVSAVASGTVAVGQVISGTGVTVGTTIVAAGTGTGGTGTYQVTPSQTASSTTITSSAATVTYDSIQQAFVITSGSVGTNSTIGYASGTLAPSLNLRVADGATISAGSNPLGAAAFMPYIYSLDQNWSVFTHLFSFGTNAKLALAAWTSSMNDQVAYIGWANDAAATTANDTTSFFYQLHQAAYNGTIPLYTLAGAQLLVVPFVLSIGACYNFAQTNGRATFAYRSQAGLLPSVTDATSAANLQANKVSYYGAYGLNGQQLPQNILFDGNISGNFLWSDSFMCQIWMNSSFQAELFSLLQDTGVIPYNADGYALIDAALADPINAAVNFGAVVSGVVLSASEAADVNNAAGASVASIIQTRGWYLQVLDPGPTIRGSRGSPVINYWYTDGQSVQLIQMTSTLIV